MDCNQTPSFLEFRMTVDLHVSPARNSNAISISSCKCYSISKHPYRSKWFSETIILHFNVKTLERALLCMTHEFLQFSLSPLFSCTNAHRCFAAVTAVAASYQLTLSCQRPIRFTEHMPSSCQRCLALCFGSIILIIFFSVGRKFIRHGARVSHSISQSIAYELIFVVSIIFTLIANAWREIARCCTNTCCNHIQFGRLNWENELTEGCIILLFVPCSSSGRIDLPNAQRLSQLNKIVISFSCQH